MTLKTPCQRRVMRKAIKMARAGQCEIAAARFDRVLAAWPLFGGSGRSPTVSASPLTVAWPLFFHPGRCLTAV